MDLDAVNQTFDHLAGKAQQEEGLSAQSFLISLGVYGGLLIPCVGLFTWLKNVSHAVFQPGCIEDQEIRPLPPGIDWLKGLKDMVSDDETLQRKHGLDSYFVMRFLHVALKLLILPSMTVLPALLPVYYTARNDSVAGLDKLSISNVPEDQGARCWIIAIVALLANLYFGHVLSDEFDVIARTRQRYLQRVSQSGVSATILVTEIPAEIWNRETLTQIFAQLGGGAVEVMLLRERECTTKEAEYNQLLHTAGSRPSGKLRLRSRVMRPQEWVDEMLGRGHLRRRLHGLAADIQSIRSVAILRFASLFAAHLSLQTPLSSQPSTMATHLIDESSIHNAKIYRGRAARALRNCTATVALVCLSLLWVVPIAMTGLLSQLVYLSSLSALLARLSNTQLSFIQALLPQAGLAVLMYGFPLMLVGLARLFHCYSDAARQVLVQRHYFFFLYVQVFLVVSVSSSLTTMIPDIFRSIQSVPTMLGKNLPKACDYFYSYLLMQAVTQCVLAFFQLPQSLWTWLTARVRRSSRKAVTWSLIYPVLTNLLCICLIFSVTSPLILPVGTLVFGLFGIAYAYQIIYVLESTVETAGMLYWEALQQLFVGIYTLDLFLVGLFILRNAYGPAVLAAVVLALVAALQYHSHQRCRPLVQFLSASVSCATPSS
ncbi:hypothetical protein BDQ94DRAFT_176579 [Aspergillus welwitschiae]|uniref:DUF221-domain-containing protein n=1 Tax=Aspergillus welwitschiae TaxID=1341132 RepID=A0A3F3PHG5_9EURO|nr:hypothetical protein BDQ94DRAFT_176579 [Aspergillus welwitschiae]RDH26183.1 hypothetical protein BDQ94DRAFT_176579 [Aspergillus welwitschiae]